MLIICQRTNIAPGYKYLYHTIRAINMTSVSIVAIAAGTAAVGVGAVEKQQDT